MQHRLRPALVVVVSLLFAAVAMADEVPADRQTAPDESLASLNALFNALASSARITIAADGTGSMPAATVEVVVARIGPDGKVITGCVNDIRGAERFFGPLNRDVVSSAREK